MKTINNFSTNVEALHIISEIIGCNEVLNK